MKLPKCPLRISSLSFSFSPSFAPLFPLWWGWVRETLGMDIHNHLYTLDDALGTLPSTPL